MTETKVKKRKGKPDLHNPQEEVLSSGDFEKMV